MIADAHSENRTYSLRYALILEGKDPIAGDAKCIANIPCEFLTDSDSDIALKFRRSSGELEVDCSECSLSGGRNKIYCDRCRESYLYKGREFGGIETLLVIRKRPVLGTLLLAY